MPLGNWIMFEEGVPERLHFTGFRKERREITDPGTGGGSFRMAAIFDVDEENGHPVTAQLSVIAEKLYGQLEPYTRDNSYKDFDFTITKTGSGFRTSYSVVVTPRR
jgi:hypothetical protein